MILEAIYEWNGRYMMVRCPHCNCWDRNLTDAKPGTYECDECGQKFLLGAHA